MRSFAKALPLVIVVLKTEQGRAVVAKGANGLAAVADRVTGRKHSALIEKARAAAEHQLRRPQQGGGAPRR